MVGDAASPLAARGADELADEAHAFAARATESIAQRAHERCGFEEIERPVKFRKPLVEMRSGSGDYFLPRTRPPNALTGWNSPLAASHRIIRIELTPIPRCGITLKS